MAMLLEVRRLMDQIDEVLSRKDEVGRQTWDFLTGLRGPDGRYDDVYYYVLLKEKYTNPLRTLLFPRTAAGGVDNWELSATFARPGADFPNPHLDKEFYKGDLHWRRHMMFIHEHLNSLFRDWWKGPQ